MRPTKEMIMETQALIARTDQDIREIVKENEMVLKKLRKKKKKRKNLLDRLWIFSFIF